MLYTVIHGNVPGVKVNQHDIVYLVSSIERIALENCDWCFTDGHAVEKFSNFYTEQSELRFIDWEIIQSWTWGNTDTDPQRQRKKQAECLVHRYFPLVWVREIGVADNATARRINKVLSIVEPRPAIAISVRPKWYYDLD
jgi:hypothetical protein